MMLFLFACHAPAPLVDVPVSSRPTTGSTFVTYDGVQVSLTSAQLDVGDVELFGAAEALAWVPSWSASAHAHGYGGERSLGMVHVARSVDLLAPGVLGTVAMPEDASLSAALGLTAVRFEGVANPPSGPVPFVLDVPLAETVVGVRADFAVDGSAIDLHIGLPAMFSHVDWSADADGDGRLDAADPAFVNTLLFGVRSVASYTLRSVDHPRTTRELAIANLPSDPERGEAAYVEHCSACHGADGEGVTGPALASHLNGQARLDLIDVVLSGVGTMPAFEALPDDVLADLFAHTFHNHR